MKPKPRASLKNFTVPLTPAAGSMVDAGLRPGLRVPSKALCAALLSGHSERKREVPGCRSMFSEVGPTSAAWFGPPSLCEGGGPS